jgi:hypothetical protein
VEQGQSARAEKAQARIAALEPRLAKVRIEVPADVAAIDGLAIAHDAVAMGREDWGKFVPVDVGKHDVTASAPGHDSFRKRFEITKDGQSVTVKVEFATAKAVQPNAPKPTASLVDKPDGERSWQMPLGIAALAVGGAGIVLGAVMGGLAISRKNASNEEGGCNDDAAEDADVCSKPEGVELREEGMTFGNVSTGAFVAGAVLAAGGVVLMVTAPSDDVEASALELRVSPGGMSLVGAF